MKRDLNMWVKYLHHKKNILRLYLLIFILIFDPSINNNIDN